MHMYNSGEKEDQRFAIVPFLLIPSLTKFPPPRHHTLPVTHLSTEEGQTYSKSKVGELPSVSLHPFSRTLLLFRSDAGALSFFFSSASLSPVFRLTLLFTSSSFCLSLPHSLQITSTHQLLLLQLAAARLHLLHVSA